MKIISGGQTGIDRAALDAAIELGLPVGGFCPRGRRAEDGRIPDKYPLKETGSSDYRPRTRLNVQEADLTLVLHPGPPTTGSKMTVEMAGEEGKQVLVVDVRKSHLPHKLDLAVLLSGCEVLNVAGPRESKYPGIQKWATEYLKDVFHATRTAWEPSQLTKLRSDLSSRGST